MSLINFLSGTNPGAPWINISRNLNTIELGDGWAAKYNQEPSGSSQRPEAWPTSGDASWVDVQSAAEGAHFFGSTPVELQIMGPANTGYSLEFYVRGFDGRVTRFTQDGGTPVDAPSANDSTVILSGQTNGDGISIIEIQDAPSSSGSSYVNAARFAASAATPDPSITITSTTPITPGTTLTATASNFAAAPTTISLSDGASPALTPALTATASGDDFNLSAVIADFKALADTAGEGNPVQGLRIGTITATVE